MAKVISLKQPWAWLLFHGKDIENRKWKTKYRGPIFIQASMVFDYQALNWLRSKNLMKEFQMVCEHFGITQNYSLFFDKKTKGEFGGIIGKVDIIDIVENSSSIWAMEDQNHWVVANPVEMPFELCKGQLGIFDK